MSGGRRDATARNHSVSRSAARDSLRSARVYEVRTIGGPWTPVWVKLDAIPAQRQHTGKRRGEHPAQAQQRSSWRSFGRNGRAQHPEEHESSCRRTYVTAVCRTHGSKQ
eukprot:scaffold27400_cov140-Isochrysis_galbana.AAC.5